MARALGQALRYPVVDKDDASDVLMNYLDPYGPAAYEVMFSQAASLLERGFSVIVDSPLRGKVGLENALNLAKESQAEVRVLECFCSDPTEWRNRIETRARRPAHVLKTWDDLERYWQMAEQDFDYAIDLPHLKLDMIEPLKTNIETVLSWLSEENHSGEE